MFQGLRNKSQTRRAVELAHDEPAKVIEQRHARHRPFGATYGDRAMQKFNLVVARDLAGA
jgi:hypothetical protein